MLNTLLRGHYRIHSHLGSGGLGQTYLAEDIDLPTHPTCVVKQLKPDSSEPFVLEAAKRLFTQEAEILYSLSSHDRIPSLLAHFQEGEEFYLVQEFADAKDLTKEIGNCKRLTEFVVIDLLQDILEILVSVHERGVLHRDIKPANLIRRNADRKIVLIDFGAVKEINCLVGYSKGNTNLTIMLGSPNYIPIEQVNGKPRFSSDIKMVRFDFRQRYQIAPGFLTAFASLSSINGHDLLTLQEALVRIEEALKFEPNHADAWAAKGFSLAKLERDNEAIAAYDKALEIKPDFPFVRQSHTLLKRRLKPKKK
ncbi:MAG: protein kinase domain-containing protein [Pseudanabaena sp.]